LTFKNNLIINWAQIEKYLTDRKYNELDNKKNLLMLFIGSLAIIITNQNCVDLLILVLSNVFLVISNSASNGELDTSLCVFRVVVVGDGFVNNKDAERKGIGHNGCLKYRRRSIGFVQ
jgi:hypothetical protein